MRSRPPIKAGLQSGMRKSSGGSARALGAKTARKGSSRPGSGSGAELGRAAPPASLMAALAAGKSTPMSSTCSYGNGALYVQGRCYIFDRRVAGSQPVLACREYY